ncbi:MAG: preprotein translocase subunit SecE [Chitinophagales bacterium]|nr:preprotein translocase subunit SecE [Chitinophagales bacterium]MDW8419708.1 preprotein translocase subunit SecE [Chitinophagales bacterium]
MEKIKEYFIESYQELTQKVTWPTWNELQDSSVVVLVTAVLISLIVVVMDASFKWGLTWFYEKIVM